MFGLTSLELRLALYGVVLAAIGSWLVYERHHLIAEGEARIKAQDTAARTAQKAEDEKVSSGVVNDLNQRLAALATQPPVKPLLRLCNPTRYVRTEPPAPGAQPVMAPASGTSSGGMSEGTAGIDIGQPVLDVKRAAEVVAIYRDTTWEWAVRQAQPVH